MIVEALKKVKSKYEVTISGNNYLFDEEIIVKYRLVKDKEIDEITLKKAIKKNESINYYNKALNYAFKYGKNKAQVYDYLAQKGLDNSTIAEIILDLSKIKAFDDDLLIDNIIQSLIRKGNGILLIKKKLYERKFNSDVIEEKLQNINYEEYIDYLYKLYEKIKNKYKGEPYIVKQKIKNYLLSRGYSLKDISYIDF